MEVDMSFCEHCCFIASDLFSPEYDWWRALNHAGVRHLSIQLMMNNGVQGCVLRLLLVGKLGVDHLSEEERETAPVLIKRVPVEVGEALIMYVGETDRVSDLRFALVPQIWCSYVLYDLRSFLMDDRGRSNVGTMETMSQQTCYLSLD
jgi:hypothetical protein